MFKRGRPRRDSGGKKSSRHDFRLANIKALFSHRTKSAEGNPKRHRPHLTLLGPEGRKWRIALVALAAVVLIAVLAVTLKKERQLMSMPEVATVKSEGILKVGVLEDMAGLYENGTGLEAQLSLMLAERILPDAYDGNAAKYVAVNSKTVMPRLSDGEINVAAALCEKGASAQYVYSETYLADKCRFVILNGARIEARDITVGVLQNSTMAKLLDEYIAARPSANIEKQLFAGYTDMLLALEKNRIDAAVMTDIYLQLYSKTYAVTGTSLELGQIEYAFMCASDCAAIVQIADIMLSELKESGELEAMYEEYGLPIFTKPYGG